MKDALLVHTYTNLSMAKDTRRQSSSMLPPPCLGLDMLCFVPLKIQMVRAHTDLLGGRSGTRRLVGTVLVRFLGFANYLTRWRWHQRGMRFGPPFCAYATI